LIRRFAALVRREKSGVSAAGANLDFDPFEAAGAMPRIRRLGAVQRDSGVNAAASEVNADIGPLSLPAITRRGVARQIEILSRHNQPPQIAQIPRFAPEASDTRHK
jgi:hypothetical protein